MGRVWMFRRILRLGRGIWDSDFIMFCYDYGVMIDAEKLEYCHGFIHTKGWLLPKQILSRALFNPTCLRHSVNHEKNRN